MNANINETKMSLHGSIMAVRKEIILAVIMNKGIDEHDNG